jgi:hypothetical protein
MKPNGPAIWGGCVTRRKHRVESWYFSRETLSEAKGHGASLPAGRQGGYGAFFAIKVQSFVDFTGVAVQGCQGVSQLSRCS